MNTGRNVLYTELVSSSVARLKRFFVWRRGVLAGCLVLLWAAGAANGQNTLGPLVLGQPVTANGTGTSGQTASSSPIFVDATQFAGAAGDVCKQINNAISLAGNGGVVDARGFTGTSPLKCASNMFPSNATGKLLLGNVVLQVSQTQVQPNQFQVEGTGWSFSTQSNTVIRACAGTPLPPQCPTALGGTTPILWCWGQTGSCGSSTGMPANNTPSFGSLTQYMVFDCAGLLNCISMRAYYVQEGSGCWHCRFQGWGNGGIGLDVCEPGTSSCQNSSFFDLLAGITTDPTPSAAACTTGAVAIHVNGSDAGPKFIKQVTVDAHNCTGGHPYDSFEFSTNHTTLENMLLGQGTTVGLRVGGEADVDNVTINGVQTAVMADNTTITECGSSSGTSRIVVLLDSGHLITNTTLLSIGTIPTAPVAQNIIRDCNNSNNTIVRSATEKSVAQYKIGPISPTPLMSGLVVFTSSSSVPTFPSAPRSGVNLINATTSITAPLDMTKGSVQQVVCAATGTGATLTLAPTNIQSGMEMTFIFVQNSSVAVCTVSYGTKIHGGSGVSGNVNSVSTQQFVVSNNGTDLYAVAAGTTCLSACGAP